MTRDAWIRSLVPVVVWAAAACGDETRPTATATEPTAEAGALAVVLATPATDDGAVRFRLDGPGISGIRAAHEGVTLYTAPAGDAWAVAVVGSGLTGPLVRFDVPDVRAAAAYSATLVEVAGEDARVVEVGERRLSVGPGR